MSFSQTGAEDPGQKSLPANTASEQQMFESYEGQKVSSVELAGQPNTNTDQFSSLLQIHQGDEFSKAKMDSTAAALRQSGKFKEVRIEVTPAAEGVRVRFVLEPAVYLGVFNFPGVRHFPYSRLIQVTNYPPQTPYSPQETQREQQDLLTFLRQQGYFQAKVDTQVHVEEPYGVANIDFPTTMGRSAKFGETAFSGVSDLEQRHLQQTITSFMARLRTAAIRPGKAYHLSTITKATTYLQGSLAKQGYLGAQVKLSGAEYHADSNRADIHFDVTTGPKIQVEVKGAHMWSWTKKSLLPVYQGVGIDDEIVQEGRHSLESYFQAKGYFDVKVDANLSKASESDKITYTISKQKKHKVDEIKVAGNRQLKSDELSAHIAVQKKHLFSSGKFSDQLVRSSVKNLKGLYASEGFSDAQVVATTTRDGGDINVLFTVTEGPRDIVHSITIEGAKTMPASDYAPDGLKIVAGQPYSAAHVTADRATIVSNYLKAGYLTSSFRETAHAVSKNEPHSIDVVYHVEEGPKVTTGAVVTLGRYHTRQKFINPDIASLQQGKPLTETALLSAGARLYDHTGVFDWAEVDPKRSITTQDTEDVLVKVHEERRNRIQYGFGFEVINRGGSIPSGTVALPNLPPVGLPSNFTTSQKTFYGPRGTFQYTRSNIRGKGESMSVTAFAGRLDQRLAFYYINPTFRWSPWKATTSLSYEKNEQNPIFSSQQELGTFQVQRALDNAGANILFLRYGYSNTNLTHVLIDQLVLPADQHVRLSTLSANLTRDTRDNPLDEHRGVLDSAEIDFNTSKLGSNVDFAKLTTQAAFYKQKYHGIVWANSVRLGLAVPFAGSRVPISEAFFTGGGNSLRGFPLDGAGPQRAVSVCSSGSSTNCTEIKVPAGGNQLLILNAEARIPVPLKKGLAVVPFYDGGNVFRRVSFNDFTSLYANNVGVGIRYATPIGPIRFDLGQNLNPVDGVKSTQYFFSIGQAF